MKKIIYIALLMSSFCFAQNGQYQYYELLRQYQSAPVSSVEIFPTGNVATIGIGEANVDVPWTGLARSASEVSTAYAYNGTYSSLITNTSDVNTSNYARFDFESIDGKTCIISFYALTTQGTQQAVSTTGFATNVVFEDITSDLAWTHHEYTLIASGTGTKQLLFYVVRGGPAVIGDTLYLDAISILEQ